MCVLCSSIIVWLSPLQPYQQVIYAPQGGHVMYTPPGGVAAGGGAAPLVVSAGTMPLHSTVQPQPLISALNNPTQPPGEHYKEAVPHHDYCSHL